MSQGHCLRLARVVPENGIVNGFVRLVNPGVELRFGNQVRDDMSRSIVSGCTIWTAYEAGLWRAYANDWLPYSNNWLLFVAWMLFMPVRRLFHFHWVHRLIHWEPLYKACHYIHHKNVNIGPWSGMSMQPPEHIFYFGCMLIHVIVPTLHRSNGGLVPGFGWTNRLEWTAQFQTSDLSVQIRSEATLAYGRLENLAACRMLTEVNYCASFPF